MPNFAYTARDTAGQVSTGSVSAETVAAALQLIRAEGRYPVSVQETPENGEADDAADAREMGRAGVKVPRSEVIQLATQLSVMLDTGVTLIDALECVGQQEASPAVTALVADLAEQLQGGTSFSAALERHPRSFPRLFVALMKASEKSGMMSKLLQRAVAYLRDEQDTVRKVRGALTYPSIMLGFAVTTTVFLLAFVLPRFTVIYANKRAALPVPTKVLMGMSDLVVNHWFALVAGIAATVTAAYYYLRTPGGRRVWDQIQLNAPLLGPMFRKLHLARGLRMVGTMAGAGVPLTECIATARDLCANGQFRGLWDRVSEQIQAGQQLSEPLFASPLVPRSVAQMIFSGEKSGKLASVMEQVATYSELELKERIAAMTRYIEPAMIVIMGVIIGGVALAMLLPIFTISKVMSA